LQANCFLVDDGAGIGCAIDPGAEPERLAAIVEKAGLQLTHILLTHGHFDHLNGAAQLAEATGAQIVCHAGVAPMLADPAAYIPFPGFEGAPGRQPDLLVKDDDVIVVGALRATVTETPGHSPGDVTYEIGGHLFCGDLLFYRSVGRTDFPGGDYATLVASVQKLVDRYPPDTTVHPGHMQDTNLGDEERANPFLSGALRRG
jgi:glyoxylase-like metal-dependent hydrolase (beta-lactamase superfamily II)